MGLFFKKKASTENLRFLFEDALREHPTNEADLQDRADRFVRAASNEKEFDARSFVIAVVLLAALMTVAIVVDHFSLVSDASVYTGMVSTALAVVLGFLGGEASGS